MSGTLKIGGKTLATHDTSSNQINLHSDILATTTQVQGVLKSFSGAHSDGVTTLTLNTVTDLSVGDYVIGEGIAVGVTVSSINSGNNTIVISTGLDLDGGSIAGGEPITFYNATKALSAGTVAGGLCRAWVNFYGGPNAVYIRASQNVSSCQDNGTGDYTVNFATAMPDENYACLLMTSNRISTSGAYSAIGYHTTDNTNASAYLAGSIRIFIKRADSTTVDDKGEISVAIFR